MQAQNPIMNEVIDPYCKDNMKYNFPGKYFLLGQSAEYKVNDTTLDKKKSNINKQMECKPILVTEDSHPLYLTIIP